jgi:hypothetical protein
MRVSEDACVESARAALRSRGYAWIERDFHTPEHAFALAHGLVAECCADEGSASLSVIGDFVLPPADRGPSRDFQTLHFDFGVPLEPSAEQDVALYTALHVPKCIEHVSASTRLVALSRLLSQRTWASRPQLVDRLIRYGRTHGAWDDACGYAEGSLARIVEAADGESLTLPSVKVAPDFLCGLEFDGLAAELEFFTRHGLLVEEVEVEVRLRPGQLLVFDNLAVAHGRRGTRQPGELHQRVFGHEQLGAPTQLRARERLLDAFCAGQPRL